jgi:homocysteine S-methyltransferase
MKAAVPEGRFSAVPNAGWPENVRGRIMYPAGPDYFGDYALAFRHAGADVIGGCCGTTPGHIAAMCSALAKTRESAYQNGFVLRVAERQPSERAPEKTSQLMARLEAGKFSIAVEMSPPRGLSTHKIHAAAGMLADVGANVINVADSPRARMRMSPWAVCEIVQRSIGVETTLHFPTRGRNLLRLQGDLLAAHAIGVRNVFVVMGDPTVIGDYPEAMDNYDLVPTGLIKLIKDGFNSGVDAAGEEIGEPTHFYVGAALNLTPSDPAQEIKVLRKKIDSGADFFLTQPVFQPEEAQSFIKLCQDELAFDKPILMGVLPLYGARHARFLHNEVPGISISDNVLDDLEMAGDDGSAVGIQLACELVETMKPHVQGIYIMPPFGRYEMAAEIIEKVKVV